ncbi:MAG: KpsF/GutQ family sugar-phosphate isomerase [Elusimicrobia bacterium]|nr:KpsF/GutQ family sugar-phosphate isomerase [Elusimicrobiota bacterium]
MPATASQSILRDIRRVLRLEAAALADAEAAVGEPYAEAVRLLLRCRGKVIVTGMGKSGLVGQKVAATLASTGTPALYLHPADAMHGGLGVIQRQDVVLAFGKSGESEELNVLLPVLRRLGARLVAVVSNASSTLGRAADIRLVVPVDREACPLNLAPTSSTTAALAVGDALAVALMKLRAFRKEHFALFHPGGRLGRRLVLRVADVMNAGEQNPTVRLGAPLSETLLEMTRKHCGATSVVDARGRLAGLVTDYDVRRMLEAGRDPRAVSSRELMNRRPTTVFADALAHEAAQLMAEPKRPLNVVPVLDRRTRKVVGMLHVHQLRARGL